MPFNQLRRCPSAWPTAVAVILAFVSITPAWAQFFRNSAVGGVAIDAKGVVSQPTAKATEQLRKMMHDGMQPMNAELEASTDLRRISLRGLCVAISDATADNR